MIGSDRQQITVVVDRLMHQSPSMNSFRLDKGKYATWTVEYVY